MDTNATKHMPRPWRARVDARGWWRIGPVRIEPRAGEDPADRKRLATRIEALPSVEAERDGLRAENTRLREVLSGLTGLAKMRGGHLHEYKSAVAEAEEILSNTYAAGSELPTAAATELPFERHGILDGRDATEATSAQQPTPAAPV